VTETDAPPIERGSNPQPPAGWPWNLTDYEIEYVRRFNARPPREGWECTDRDERRLDDEADGVRQQPMMKPKRERGRVHVAWLAVPLVILAGAVPLALPVVSNVEALADFDEKQTIFEKVLSLD
jgi:hypothetical protein